MRPFAIILIVLFALAGAVFGALNADLVEYDLILASIALPKGAALIGALVIGWVLGGLLVWLVSTQPARRRLARELKRAREAHADGDTDPPRA